jgi:hypothetical protein
MPARLKVFITSDGLTEYVVAASSRAKALAAWGVHQDLFKTGAAHETDDPAVMEAARANPGEVLRRPADAQAALANLESGRSARLKPSKPPRPKPPSKVLLRRIEDLEVRLKALEADHDAEGEAILAARADLDDREGQAETRYRAERARLGAALKAARASL